MNEPPRTVALPYCEDGAAYLDRISEMPWAGMLDSGPASGRRGRYDIIVAAPVATLVTRGPVTELTRNGTTERHADDPFHIARDLLGQPGGSLAGIPFAGGWLGAFGYDLARRLERLPERAEDGEGTPDLLLGLYDWAVVVDHEGRTAWLASHLRDPSTAAQWDDWVERFRSVRADPPESPGTFRMTSPVVANLDREAYGERFRRVQAYLRAGDCYQVNLARRFSARVAGDPWTAYRRLRELSPAPYGAYLQTPFAQILSNSPERFLRVRDRRVETRPIKGTRARGHDPEEDERLRDALATSPKDRAENVMIVDLLRNDLGKTARYGSVRTPELCRVETYATVHHLVSTVVAELDAGAHAADVLRGSFPGGSITGAPKVRAMEIIEELEPHRRGFYCGAIGYLGYDGNMDTSIAIRTLVHSEGEVRFWAGGGLVMDSDEEAEFQETLDKAEAMMRLLRAAEAAGGDR